MICPLLLSCPRLVSLGTAAPPAVTLQSPWAARPVRDLWGYLLAPSRAGGRPAPRVHAPFLSGTEMSQAVVSVSRRGRPSVRLEHLRHPGTPCGLCPPALGLRLSSAALFSRHLPSLGDCLGAPSRLPLKEKTENPARECRMPLRASDCI